MIEHIARHKHARNFRQRVFVRLHISFLVQVDETAEDFRIRLMTDRHKHAVGFKIADCAGLQILQSKTFNVIGSLTMLIIEKKKDIQTLMFLGADKNLIRKIFMREGLMITLTGAVSGLLLGLLICWIQITYKPVPFSEGFVVDAYPVKIIPMDLLLVFSTVMLIGFFAAWYPVRIFTRKFQ